MQVKKQQLETDMEQLTGLKFGERIWQGCFTSSSFNIFRVLHAVCQAEWLTSWNQDWQEKYQQAQISEEEINSLLVKVKDESEKSDSKHNIKKTKIVASSHITSWQIEGEKVEPVIDFIFLCSKITADGDSSVKLKDGCSLEEKLW